MSEQGRLMTLLTDRGTLSPSAAGKVLGGIVEIVTSELTERVLQAAAEGIAQALLELLDLLYETLAGISQMLSQGLLTF